jgi:hypothetical protein
MRRGLWIAVVTAIAIAAGCQKSAERAPAQGSAAPAPAGSGGSAAPAPTPAIPSNAALSRPASVTDEEVKVADAFVAATETLANDVAAAGTDCKKAAAAIQANVPKLAPLVAEGDKLRAQANADPEAKRWFQTNYVPKMMAAAGKMNPTTQACKDDADFVAAAKSIPMGQPPPPPAPAVVPAPSTAP